jgi:hypothetical protein
LMNSVMPQCLKRGNSQQGQENEELHLFRG